MPRSNDLRQHISPPMLPALNHLDPCGHADWINQVACREVWYVRCMPVAAAFADVEFSDLLDYNVSKRARADIPDPWTKFCPPPRGHNERWDGIRTNKLRTVFNASRPLSLIKCAIAMVFLETASAMRGNGYDIYRNVYISPAIYGSAIFSKHFRTMKDRELDRTIADTPLKDAAQACLQRRRRDAPDKLGESKHAVTFEFARDLSRHLGGGEPDVEFINYPKPKPNKEEKIICY